MAYEFEKNFGPKKLLDQNFIGQKKCMFKIISCSKEFGTQTNFGLQKLLVQKICWFQKNFRPKNQGQKNVVSKKDLGPKKV